MTSELPSTTESSAQPQEHARIRVLSEQLINQIAAGEVVERPASVVKELSENALDAGARSIRVELTDGGLRRILVVDDGCGMSPADAQTCLLRHATSKLSSAEGLTQITTMGFRGEAVPAIASVSRFTLTTREPAAASAVRLIIDGGKLQQSEEVGAPVGTSILVEDLFFNTPARRKFMKRAETEAGHACEAVVRLALARPEVGFTLISGSRQVFVAPASPKDPRERVAAALGNDIFSHLLAVDWQRDQLSVHGFVASPDYSLATARGIYTFVNGRFVRDRGLLAAIQRAYAQVMPAGRQPAVVLFLETPPSQVDVNVHPQKLEVRFADSRAVFDAVYAAIQKTLRNAPWLTNHAYSASPDSLPSKVSEPSGSYGVASRPVPAALNFGQPATSLSSGKPQPFAPNPGQGDWQANHDASNDFPNGVHHDAVTTSVEEQRPPAKGFFGSLRVIGQFARTYLICEGPGPQLVIIDQHAAHERLKFHQLREAFRSRQAKGQAFLFPASVELPVAEARVLAGHLPEIIALGFELEPFGGTTYALKAVPAALVGCDYRRLLTDLAAEFMQVERGRAFDQAMDEILATMACHCAVRAHQALTPEESRVLLDSLDTIDFNTRCPHGRPISTQMSLAELERLVGRR